MGPTPPCFLKILSLSVLQAPQPMQLCAEPVSWAGPKVTGMSPGPLGLPGHCQLAVPGCRCWPSVAPGTDWSSCSRLCTLACSHQDPDATHLSLEAQQGPLPTRHILVFPALFKAPRSGRAGLQHVSIHTHSLIPVTKHKCPCTAVVCVLICHQSGKASQTR